MKKLLFLLALIVLGISCESPPPTETELYVYLDFTEGQDYGDEIEDNDIEIDDDEFDLEIHFVAKQ